LTTEKPDEKKLMPQKQQKNALSTFYSFLVEKVDCGIIAKSELSGIEPNLLRTNGC
jgi:hypothetical protein